MRELTTTSTDGTRIAYTVAGSGYPVMLLHGLCSNKASWHEAGYVDLLTPHFTVVTMDGRGHGNSGKPSAVESYAFDRVADDVLAVADDCKLDRFALVGFSWGGSTALRLSARSSRIDRVVALGASFGKAMSAERRDTLVVFWARVLAAQRAETVDQLELSDDDRDELSRLDVRAILAATRALEGWAPFSRDEQRVPTMIVVGENDERFSHTAEAIVVPGCDHVQTMTRTEVILPLVMPFLRDTDTPRSARQMRDVQP